MSDFWISSGHHLVDRDEEGRLVVTDALLKAYLARPEILPPADACLVERAMHQRLLRNPREPVPLDEIAAIADRDARENWLHLIAFRDHLLRHPTIEAAYVALARSPRSAVPPLFLNQLVHLILRNLLDGETDPFKLRAAELFFRAQRLTLKDGIMLLADEEEVGDASGDIHGSPLIAMFGDAKAESLDVMTADTAALYFNRSEAFDMVLDFRQGEAARRAFSDVIEIWVRSLLGVSVQVEPVERIAEESWAWFVGLDQEATQIGNALWRGEEPPHDGRERVVALFQLAFVDLREMLDKVQGARVSLILAMSPNRLIRMKPQNLIAGLPLKSLAGAS